jgi:hypothetical protein
MVLRESTTRAAQRGEDFRNVSDDAERRCCGFCHVRRRSCGNSCRVGSEDAALKGPRYTKLKIAF